MLEAVATRTPNAIAVESLDERLSYRAFWQAVCRLRTRIESVEQSDAPIAILLPNGVAYVVAVFAVLAAKRISVLLDQSYPDSRNATIAATVGVKLVLAPADLVGKLAWRDVVTVSVDSAFDEAIAADSPPHPPLALDAPGTRANALRNDGAARRIVTGRVFRISRSAPKPTGLTSSVCIVAPVSEQARRATNPPRVDGDEIDRTRSPGVRCNASATVLTQ